MKRKVLMFATGLLSCMMNLALAQHKVTLYYDANNKGVESKKQCTFYREVNFDDQKKPVGEIRDYWKNGKLQTIATGALYIDKNDDANTIWTGKVELFDKKEKRIEEINFSDSGLAHGTSTTYDAKGQPLTVAEYENGLPAHNWYIKYQKGSPVKISYLNHLPLTALTEDKVIHPLVERKVIYDDGRVIQYYFNNGVSIAVQFTEENLYGKYYASYITIENGTDEEIVLNPDNFTVVSLKGGNAKKEDIIPYAKYMKKVKRKQGWSSFFNAFAEGQAASQAGYSALASSGAVAAVNNRGGAAVAYGEQTSVGYSGAAQYAANQQARQNVQQYDNAQYNIRNSISQGYLKINTVMPHSRVIGYVNVKKSKMDGMILNIPIRDKIYQFQW
ncbi:hypothetical protein K2F45_06890 [Sphingobacterium siyangense]|uniref:hypothetical protein n=1 Tax=Sphingobacterium siyangense TaxID=459529 RepID=UPI00200CC890|nr:hypothetical protein [Sphingobacterium siyangense]UQA76713.1 hypothetical protein K2F45_06890 [Sphingobacterium siyangense]